jgi:hypothetical protein
MLDVATNNMQIEKLVTTSNKVLVERIFIIRKSMNLKRWSRSLKKLTTLHKKSTIALRYVFYCHVQEVQDSKIILGAQLIGP